MSYLFPTPLKKTSLSGIYLFIYFFIFFIFFEYYSRAAINPYTISVIPNAVDSNRFRPDPSKRFPLNTINIVYVARLTFRKGTDLLIDVIPKICQK